MNNAHGYMSRGRWLLLATVVSVSLLVPAVAAQPLQPAPEPAETTPAEGERGVPEMATGTLRLHVIDTRNRYATIGLDVFRAETRQLVVSGESIDEARGEPALSWELAPGLYKIVPAGESFGVRTDFATVDIEPGEIVDFVIVVDPATGNFRGAGIVTDGLPTGATVAGIRINLSAGGNLMLTQQANVVGETSGTTSMAGLFANFGMVFDRDNHYVDVRSDLELSLLDRPSASSFATTDLFTGEALYAYNINNPYIGPYIRGSFRTSLFPSYLYLESDSDTVTVTRQRINGTTETQTVGDQANQDDLRVELTPALSPIILQEEVGANLKAFSLDLSLVQLDIGTRIGYGFRQGLVRDLYVVEGDHAGPSVTLVEVDDYSTHGPTAGANAQVSVTRWLFGKASVSALAPLKDQDRAGDSFAERLLLSVTGTAGLRIPILTDLLHATFDYTFRLERDGYLTSDTQLDHTIMTRANVSLF